MKKFILSMALLALIFAICAGLAGCSSIPADDLDSSDTEQNTTDSIDYKLTEHEGKKYLVFDNISAYYDPQCHYATLEFKSLAEFKDTVTNGKLDNRQKSVISSAFEKDEIGVPTCDFDKLSEPDLPSDCITDQVSWSGEAYSFHISTSSEVFGWFNIYTQSIYNQVFKREYEDYFKKDTIVSIEESFETDDGKSVTTFRTGLATLKIVRYTYTDSNKTIIVQEEYMLSSALSWYPLIISDVVPSNITLFCTEADSYYVVDLFKFEEKPSDSWIYEFGIKDYVDSNIENKNAN